MAAVTVVSQRTNIDGSYREKFYTINIASSGDTLATPFKTIKSASASNVAVTNVATSGGTVTFTTTGAVTGVQICLTGL